MGRRAWWAAVHGVAKSQTRLSNLTFTFHFHALEKEMATHSSVLAWRIPGPGESDGLLSVGSHRVGHDWSDLAAAAAARNYPIRIHTAEALKWWSVERNRAVLEQMHGLLGYQDRPGREIIIVKQREQSMQSVKVRSFDTLNMPICIVIYNF